MTVKVELPRTWLWVYNHKFGTNSGLHRERQSFLDTLGVTTLAIGSNVYAVFNTEAEALQFILTHL